MEPSACVTNVNKLCPWSDIQRIAQHNFCGFPATKVLPRFGHHQPDPGWGCTTERPGDFTPLGRETEAERTDADRRKLKETHTSWQGPWTLKGQDTVRKAGEICMGSTDWTQRALPDLGGVGISKFRREREPEETIISVECTFSPWNHFEIKI